MRIAAVEAIPLAIPYTYGASGYTLGAQRAQVLDFCLVRVETDDGIVGWGDAFAYGSCTAVSAAVRDMVAPLAVGADAADIAGLSRRLQQALHIFGRYGITLHALSGLDIALWDIAGKAAGKSLAALVGGAPRRSVPAYASLLRYADAGLVATHAARAVAAGFAAIKLHEIDEAVIAAARAAVPAAVPLMFDVNCPWAPDEALSICSRLAAHRPHWVEEPVFPPEDFASLRRIRDAARVPLAAGENWCTAVQFAQALDARAVDIVQPSVTKVGGVTEFLRVLDLAREHGVRVAPHSPYFGPGALATLQLLTRIAEPAWFELFYLDAAASLFGDALRPAGGTMTIPQGPGLGCDPDPAVIARYRTDGSGAR
ncbi:MAG: mandelate racemase/muconate lactonizing enzyme family protein [Burkholderiales bacterium]|nr:mandelate racemase/muconate lactonizing enzyme family protein [Burkholderiales bacterium]